VEPSDRERAGSAAAWLARLLLTAALLYAAPLRADGEMVLGDRVLFRQGPPADACRQDDRECDVALTKILSGYGYLRGHVLAAASGAWSERRARFSGVSALQLRAASAALPGGDLTVGRLDAVLDGTGQHQLALNLVEAEGLFFCHDRQSESLRLPFLGMTTSECSPDAVIGVDARAIALNWRLGQRVQVEWLRLGPSFELLGNGLGYAHVLRSLMLGAGADLRTSYELDAHRASTTSLGAGMRAALLWRSPRWELRLRAQHRAALTSAKGVLHDNGVVAELYGLYNFLWSDALLLQLGVVATVI
jgi:hypothetical protein